MSGKLKRKNHGRILAVSLLAASAACAGAPRRRTTALDVRAPEATLLPSVDAAAAAQDPLSETLGRSIEALRQKRGIVGLSVAVLDGDRAVLLRGFGAQDLAGNAAVTADTPFFIASVTKTFTSVLVAMAVDEGKLSLDDHPRSLLRGFRLRDPDADARVTLRDLLAHRSGLATEAGAIASAFDGLGFDGLLRVVADAKGTAKLGARFHYSNTGLALVGEAVARAEGTTYAALLDARVLAPLGMRSTAIVTTGQPDVARFLVPGYLGDAAGGAPPAPVSGWISSDVFAPAGGLRSTARDMAQWVRLMNGHGSVTGRRLVREETFAELLKPHVESDRTRIGLDFVLATWRGHRVAYHGGELLGSDALLAFLPDDGVGFAMLSNTLAPDASSVFRGDLMRTIFGALVTAPDVRVASPSEPLAAERAPAVGSLPPGSPPVEELMARTIAALGGEAHLRRHHAWESIEDAVLETQGVRARARIVAAAPASRRLEQQIFVGDRLLGTTRRWFDGTNVYVASGAPLDAPIRLPPSLEEGASEENAFYGDLTWRTLWKTVTIRGVTDVEGARAFVVEKRAASGFAVVDFVSARTFLPIRRESGAGTVTYSDWRFIDGVRIPFKRVHVDSDPLGFGGVSTVTVRSVTFDTTATEDMFRPTPP